MSPTEVGTAYVVIRALTRDVKKDIQKGFQDGLKDNKTLFARYGKEAGDEFSKNFAQRIANSVEKSLDGGTASTGNTGMSAGRAFGNSFAKEAESKTVDGHKATGAQKTRISAQDSSTAGRTFGSSFASESQRVLSQQNLTGPQVNTSQAQAKIRSLNAAGMSSSSMSINADVSGAIGSIASLTRSLGTLGKVSMVPVLTSALNGLTFSALGVVQSLGQVTNTIALLPGMIGGLLPVIGSAMLAFNGLGGAIGLALSDAPEDVEKLNEALKKLAPSAQNFVKEFAGLKEPFVEMKKNVQQEFFEPLEGSITRLAQNTLPMLNRSLTGVARETGGLLRSIMDSVGETNNVSLFGKLFDNTAAGLETLQRGMQPTISSMLRLMEASSRFLPRMGEGWYNIMTSFDNYMARVASDGTFERYVERGIEASKQWGRILGDVGVTIGNVFKAAAPTTQAFIDMIERGSERMREISGSFEGQNTMRSFFESGLRSVRTWNEVFQDLGSIIRDVLPVMQDWADIIMPVITSMTGLLADNAKLVGNLLVGFLAFKTVTGIMSAVNGGLGSMGAGMRNIADRTQIARGGLTGFRDEMRRQGELATRSGQSLGRVGQAFATLEARSATFGAASETARRTVAPAMDGIRRSATNASAAFTGSLTPAVGGFRTAAGNIGPAITNVVNPAINGLRTSAANATASLRTAGDALARFASPATSQISAAGSAVSGAVSNVTSRMMGGASSGVSSMIASTRAAVGAIRTEVSGRLMPAINQVRTGAASAWGSVASSAQNGAASVRQSINGLRGDVRLLSQYGATVTRDAVSSAATATQNMASRAGTAIQATMAPAINAVRTAATSVSSTVSTAVTPAFSALRTAATTTSSHITSAVTPALNGLRTSAGNVGQAFSSVLGPAMAGTRGTMSTVSGAITSTLTPALNGARTAAGNFATGLSTTAATAMSGFRQGVAGITDALGGPFGIAIAAATIAFANYQAGAQRGKQ
ncbi:MAG: hypothetical protein PHW63_10405, partial [Alphaproteobacteria bacterium]|nr:hypothetical protein [Alphaproteobacteria bacterium]